MALEKLERVLRQRKDAVVGTGVTDEMVRTAETDLDVGFPPDLKEYVKRFGHLEVGHFEFFGLGEQLPNYLNLVQVTKSERTEAGCPLPSFLIPLLNDGAGNLYCVIVSGDHMASIVIWDHEAGSTQIPEFQSPSLEQWILSLIEELDDA